MYPAEQVSQNKSRFGSDRGFASLIDTRLILQTRDNHMDCYLQIMNTIDFMTGDRIPNCKARILIIRIS